MGRPPEKLEAAWANLQDNINRHKKPFWLISTDDGYQISVIEPKPSELPYGTHASLYGTDMETRKTISSSKTLLMRHSA